jgi:hypothetical protein
MRAASEIFPQLWQIEIGPERSAIFSDPGIQGLLVLSRGRNWCGPRQPIHIIYRPGPTPTGRVSTGAVGFASPDWSAKSVDTKAKVLLET